MLHAYTTILCESCGTIKHVPVYCGDRFCPVCSGGRLARTRDRLTWLIDTARRSDTTELRHLTLTIVSAGCLRPMIDKLVASFRKLRSKKLWRSHVRGGAYVVEVTSGSAGYHAHLHVVIQASFIGWQQLRDLWLKISGSPGCYITRISAADAIRYLTKYLTKPEAPETDIPLIAQSLRHVRLYNPFGTWHSLGKGYVRPLHPCSVCGRAGCWTVYALVNGGKIVEMRESTTMKSWTGVTGIKPPTVA